MRTPHCHWAMLASIAVIGSAALCAHGQQTDRERSQTRTGDYEKSKVDSQGANLKRASKIMDCNLNDAQGQKLGEVDNLALDVTDGQCAYVIVTLDNAGNKRYPLPFQVVKFQGDSATLVNFDRTKLMQAPTIEEKNFASLSDEPTALRIHQYFGVQPYYQRDMHRGGGTRGMGGETPEGQQPGQPGQPGNSERDQTPGMRSGAGTTVQAHSVCKASDVIGAKVDTAQQDKLGEVEDLMIECNRGRIAYVVVGTGGFLGLGEDLRAAPWQAITIRAPRGEVQTIVLNIPKDRFEQAPKFSKSDWPSMDATWGRQIHAFYGTQPDWVYGTVDVDRPITGRDGAMADRTGDGGWCENREYLSKFNASQIETIRGRITGVQRFTPMQGMSEGVLLMVQTEGGTTTQPGASQPSMGTVKVHLGPAWYLERQPRQFKQGDQVTIKCCRADFNGESACIAQEITVDGRVMKLRDDTGHPMWSAWQNLSGTYERPGMPSQPGSDRPGGNRP